MAHVEEHAFLESLLIFLCIFDEDTAGEDQEETESEEETRTYPLGIAAVEEPVNAKEDGITDGFVELPGMPRQHINPFKDECPRHVCRATDNL